MDVDGVLRAEMLSYDSCLISDALERLGLPPGVAGLARVATGKRVFGASVTVKLEAFRGDVPKRHLGTRAIDVAGVGDVIVVEHRQRDDCAGWGGLLSTAAQRKQISGVVVDGLARDIDESEALGFPIFARGVTPVTARNRVVETETNGVVTIGSVRVEPGDYVLADGSGVAFIPRARLDDVVAAARAMLAFENGIRTALDQDTPISAAMDESYERMTAANRA